MQRKDPRLGVFNRRTLILAGGQLSLFALLAGRLYHLQVSEAERYKTLSDDNRISLRLMVPQRGRILDRFGVPVAENRKNYRVIMIRDQTKDAADSLHRLAAFLPVDEDRQRAILREFKRKRGFVPVTIVEYLDWEQFARLNVVMAELPGLQPDVGEIRHYPFGPDMAHLVGYVGQVSDAELSGDPLLEQPSFRIGKNGVERARDKILRGKAGDRHVEVNAFGREIRELQRREGTPGTNVVLTIDAALHVAISKRLSQESAAATVMDVNTGEILALSSTPGFDPGAFTMGISRNSWRALLRDPRAPLTNKTLSGQYPPGSTFKMVVALAALQAGVITPQDRFFCNGLLKVGTGRFHCWRAKYGGHGHVNLNKALAQSCDIYFYEIARKVGIERIADMAHKLGFGKSHDIGLNGQRRGLIPTPAWKRAVIGGKWQLGETLIAGIGQGYVLSTPLQLAVMTARIANGGYAVTPRLYREGAAGDPDTADPLAHRGASLGLTKSHLDAVKKGMEDVINSRRGTARTARIDAQYGRMAGKTGTAQVRRISRQERISGIRKNEEKPWNQRDHGLFVAYAPIEAPRYAVSLVIEHGGSGARAGVVARDIMNEVMRLDPIRRPALGHVAGKASRNPDQRG